jgi:hypothetical protein
VLHGRANTKSDADLRARVDSQHLSVARLGESSLVAANIRPISVGTVADVRGRVGRELDGVVARGTREVADVLERRGRSTVDDIGIEEVVGGHALGSQGAENDGRDLHGDWQETLIFVWFWSGRVDKEGWRRSNCYYCWRCSL